MAQSLQSGTTWEETYCRKFSLILQNSVSFSDIESQHFVFFIFRYCEAFPALKGAIQRVQREKDRAKQKSYDKKSSSKSELESKMKFDVASASSAGSSSKSFTLQRRLSTATPVRYDM